MVKLKQKYTLKAILPKGKYVGASNEEVRKGFILTLIFASMGYGLSAKIMGKEFTKYALYGGIWTLGSEALSILYTRYTEKNPRWYRGDL